MPVRNRWIIKPQPTSAELARYPGVHPLVAALCFQRGIVPDAVSNFINPAEAMLSNPFLLKDMDKAVDIIIETIHAGKNICIWGDYDADGITSQAVLASAFRQWGVPNISLHTPHREKEGYGLNDVALSTIRRSGADLLITVDCGITNGPEISRAAKYGLKVIVTDHHHIETLKNGNDYLPWDALAVINPQRQGQDVDLTELCGAGVAYYLVRALGKKFFGVPDNLEAIQALVAIGTVGDVVPLIRENRTLVEAGIQALRDEEHIGLAALMRVAKIKPSQIDATKIAFDLSPRLNAPGRMGSPRDARDVVLATTREEAIAAAKACDRANEARKEETRTLVAHGKELVEPLFGR